jgi:hypothetical protein
MGLKRLRWHPKPCALGVSGTAKLVEDYDDDDKYHKGSMVALITELRELSVMGNRKITREHLMQMYDEAMEKKVYVP